MEVFDDQIRYELIIFPRHEDSCFLRILPIRIIKDIF